MRTLYLKNYFSKFQGINHFLNCYWFLPQPATNSLLCIMHMVVTHYLVYTLPYVWNIFVATWRVSLKELIIIFPKKHIWSNVGRARYLLRPAEDAFVLFEVVIGHNMRTEWLESQWRHLRIRKAATLFLRYIALTCDAIVTSFGWKTRFQRCQKICGFCLKSREAETKYIETKVST